MPQTEAGDGAWTIHDLAVRIARLADDRQGADVVVMDVEAAIQVTDYFVIASGQNKRHLAALAEHVSRELKQDGIYRLGGSSLDDENWVLLDFGDVVFHAFSAEGRVFYDLESLWEDCERVEWRTEATPVSGSPD